MLDKINRIKEKLPQRKISVEEIIELGNRWEENQLKNLSDRLKRSKIRELFYGVTTFACVVGLVIMATTSNHYIQLEEVDSKTGYRALKTLYRAGEILSIKQQELFLKADVRRFIECYEGYALAKRNDNLKCVTSMAISKVSKKYMKYVDENNETGPASIIKALGQMNVLIVTSTPLPEAKNVVIVSVILTPNTPETEKLPEMPEMPVKITLIYKYKNVPTNLEKRERNPHGFMVLDYRKEYSQTRNLK
jgi:type IV secretory pathway component VirB8